MRGVALGLCIPLGWCGAHRFYTGKAGTGALMALTLGGCGLWWIYDIILVATGEYRDADGKRLTRWSRDDPRSPAELADENKGELLEEISTLRHEMEELTERMDFHERLITQMRERDKLPRA
jgi:prephenate dehydrogenase